jgi:hypothetical protein
MPLNNFLIKFQFISICNHSYHNYHHACEFIYFNFKRELVALTKIIIVLTVPWDYRAAELGSPLNLTCKFIDFLAQYGVIYDRREATENMVKF